MLLQVLVAFRECGDSFGRAATRLWQSLAYLELRQGEHLTACLEDLLSLAETHDYDFLFTAPTLLGPPDPRRIVPLLIAARDRRIRPAYVHRLLVEIGLPDIKVHAGYQLRVQTLGAFRVWRGPIQIESREWQRDKARQLFQLFIAERGRWLQRDEIAEMLWPQLNAESAARDFKVALNALNRALEPNRAADAPFAFIIREGAAYRLRPEADLWLDSAAFERACEAGLHHATDQPEQAIAHLQSAIRHYRGDYLPEALYEDWTSVERERLLALYLRASDKLAALLIGRERYNEGLEICQAILGRDACWENAYRLMMTAHARQGNRPQAMRAYQRCVDVLRDELGVAPSPATVTLYEQLAL
jgi:DNA-binding SARP family transcriptional activator